ncbi:hypothetical protein DD237_001417 [Peronospora effusa]|uniref:RXLR phytopathogen effector protein WY-domain domain-containing protein n=1 Tax=Peronospora effusa TaxID=542832 RepID=A0A3R8CZL4_9STRA|nr:hypothetical protein DD237_001417 [Peronospora effusa]
MVWERYGSEGLVTMAEAFAKAKASKAVMTTLESALVASWKVDKMSAFDVFELLKLDQDIDYSLYVKMLRMWVNYVKRSSKSPDLTMKLVIASFNDVKTRAMVLSGLIKIDGADEVVMSVQNSLSKYLKLHESKISASDGFTALRLDKAGANLFNDPNYKIWLEFVVNKTGTLPDLVAKTVSKHYSDEELLTMVEAFAKAETSDAVMTTLESALVVSWKDKKMSTFGVFKLLKLDQKVDDLLRDKLFSESKFAIWFQYAAKGGTLPKSATKIMLKHYSDDDLLTMVEAFANAKARDVVMTTLESALVVSCKDKKSFAFDVFKLLKLDQKVDDLLYDKLFSESKFAIWFQYAAKGGTLPESAAKIMLEHYSDDDLLTMFEAFANAKARDVVMTTLESALVVSWKDKKMSTFDVFTRLKLDQKLTTCFATNCLANRNLPYGSSMQQRAALFQNQRQ